MSVLIAPEEPTCTRLRFVAHHQASIRFQFNPSRERATVMCEVQFRAINVNCSEAIDWEIVQVLFDSMEDRPAEGDRTDPYVMIGVNFEFGREVSIEFHDGTDYGGGRAMTAELWRTRFTAVIRGGRVFDIRFELTEEAFAVLRTYLTLMFPKRSFRDHCLAEYGPPPPPISPPDDEAQ